MKDHQQMVLDGKKSVRKSFSIMLNCAETSLLAVADALELDIHPEMVYLSSALGGGWGERSEVTGGNCGLLAGTSMAIGLLFWRKKVGEGFDFEGLDDRNELIKLSNLWFEQFIMEAGAASCPDIVGSLSYLGEEHRRKCWYLGQHTIELFLSFLMDKDLIGEFVVA